MDIHLQMNLDKQNAEAETSPRRGKTYIAHNMLCSPIKREMDGLIWEWQK